MPTGARRSSVAVTTVADASGRLREIWVRWHEVTDFYASGPRDRHYVLDRFTGFEGMATLRADVDALRLDSHRSSLGDAATLGRLEPEILAAVERLRARIRHTDSFPVRTRRALLHYPGANATGLAFRYSCIGNITPLTN